MNNIKPNPRRRFLTWLVRGLAILAVLLILGVERQPLLDLLNLLRDRDAVAAYLEPLGLWGPLLYLLLLGAQVITAIIPGHALMIAAGYVYGFGGGLALNLMGAVLVSQGVFVVARRAGKPLVYRLVPANVLDHWDKVAQRQGFFFFLMCFWFPIMPSNATNYLAGLSSISFWLFFGANLLGRLPGLILITLIGSHGLELSWQQWGVIIPLALVVVGGGRYLSVKIEHHFSADSSMR